MAVKITESILNSTKAALGIVPEYDAFDNQIIMYINTTFSTLYQLGVGPDDGFMIEDDSTTWDEFTNGKKLLNLVISYVHLSVKLMFDPPATSFAITAMKEQQKELEWRINVMVDPSTERSVAG